jgi:hypothetical protein
MSCLIVSIISVWHGTTEPFSRSGSNWLSGAEVPEVPEAPDFVDSACSPDSTASTSLSFSHALTFLVAEWSSMAYIVCSRAERRILLSWDVSGRKKSGMWRAQEVKLICCALGPGSPLWTIYFERTVFIRRLNVTRGREMYLEMRLQENTSISRCRSSSRMAFHPNRHCLRLRSDFRMLQKCR